MSYSSYYTRGVRNHDQAMGQIDSLFETVIDFLIPEGPLSAWQKEQIANYRKELQAYVGSAEEFFNEKESDVETLQSTIEELEKNISAKDDQIDSLKELVADLEYEVAPWRLLNI